MLSGKQSAVTCASDPDIELSHAVAVGGLAADAKRCPVARMGRSGRVRYVSACALMAA